MMKHKYVCPISGCRKICDSPTHLEKHMKEMHDVSVEGQIAMDGMSKNSKEFSKQKLIPEGKKTIKPTIELFVLNVNLNYHVFISGQTGTGKSVIGKFIFALLPKKHHAIFIDIKHDPANEKFIKHFQVFTDLNEIKKHYESNNKGLFGGQKDMRVIYRPKRIKSETTKTHSLENPNWEMFQELCNWAYEKGNIVLFVDEAALFSTPHNIVPAAYEIMILGRSRSVIMVNISQRPASIHNCLISEAYTRFLLRSELESDRIKLKGIVGDEVSNQLHGLPNQQFIISYVDGEWEKAHLNIPQKLKWITT